MHKMDKDVYPQNPSFQNVSVRIKIPERQRQERQTISLRLKTIRKKNFSYANDYS